MAIRFARGTAVLTALLVVASVGHAKLPAPTPEQAKAAADKKAQAAAQTEREKQELAASMENVAERWRSRANDNGWEVHPQVSVGAAAPSSTSSAAPSAAAPVRSEKSGTAPPSEDVKDPARKGK